HEFCICHFEFCISAWEGFGPFGPPEREQMRTRGKKYTSTRQQVPPRPHKIEEAVPLVQKVKFSKFDETVEMAVRLGVDPKHSDQMVRGTVILPHGLGGKSKRVLVIANAEKQREAHDAGADEVGGEELVERITGGWM